MLSPIFTSFYSDRSRSGNTDLCINLFPEHEDGPKGPEVGALINLPGYTKVASIGPGPIRAGWVANDGMLYLVSGANVYKVDRKFNATLLGSMATNTGPVSIVDSPTQVLFVDGENAWMWPIAGPELLPVLPNTVTSLVNPSCAAYQDGFALVNSGGSNLIYQSQYNDLSAYSAPTGAGGSTANDAFIQGNPNPVVAMIDLRRELWVFKRDAAEVWVNQGATGFAFAALQGVYIEHGCIAPGSLRSIGSQLMWLGGDEHGGAMVYMTAGYQAKPIAPPALAALFQGFDTVEDAHAFAQQIDGHWFYVLTFPSADCTYVYDLASDKWTQRASWINGEFHRDRANCSFFYHGRAYVGDYQNGNVYYLDPNNYTDNGSPRKWLRSWRALTPDAPSGMPMSFDQLRILMETGITPSPDSNPIVQLRWSDDGGYTWTPYFQMTAGQIGQASWRVEQNRLGSTKIGTGLDRIFEISGDDPIRISITGAEWEGGPA